MTKRELRELIESQAVILDGATGSNLQAAGMKMGVCPEQWIIENPEAIIKLQRAYVEAGTNILYAPTFTGNRIKLAEYGLIRRYVPAVSGTVKRGGSRTGTCSSRYFNDRTAVISDRGYAV